MPEYYLLTPMVQHAARRMLLCFVAAISKAIEAILIP